MIIWGMSGKGHDASITVWDSGTLYHESYSRESRHNQDEIYGLLKYGDPELVVWYENPYTKAIRQWYAGQPNPIKRNNVTSYLKSLGINCKWTYVQHHEAHAAHYYDQDTFDEAIVVVIDSIGEWDCTSVWHAKDKKLVKLGQQRYPDSVGLFYSSMVKEAGMTPQKDEATFESLASIGMVNDRLLSDMKHDLLITHPWRPVFARSMHRGLGGLYEQYNQIEIASTAQHLFEEIVMNTVKYWTKHLKCKNVILSGGCAFNKGIRSRIKENGYRLWVPNNPGDGGSAKSCVLAYLRKKTSFDVPVNQGGLNT